VADVRILHAYDHPVRVFENEGLTMLIGADQAGRLLEVGVASADEIDYIVHAMAARRAFLR
jgi:limonene-1,2-epoxide hydrolase